MPDSEKAKQESSLSPAGQQLLALLRQKLGRRSFLHSQGLLEKLQEQTGLTRTEIRRTFAELRDRQLVEAPSWPAGEPTGKLMVWVPPIVEAPWLGRWQRALRQEGFDETAASALEAAGAAFGTWSDEDLSSLLKGLMALSHETQREGHADIFGRSAQHLMGSSKLFRAITAPLYAPIQDLRQNDLGMPPYILIAGPQEPQVVTLVENPHAFEAAMRAGLDDSAWITTFGFGLSLAGEAYGNRLADQIEHREELIPLVRAGSPPPVNDLLTHPKLYFWGDLDPAGWLVFFRLRKQLSQLQLSPLYDEMRKLYEAGVHHPLDATTGKMGQDAMPLPPDVPDWWPRKRGLDQEALKLARGILVG